MILIVKFPSIRPREEPKAGPGRFDIKMQSNEILCLKSQILNGKNLLRPLYRWLTRLHRKLFNPFKVLLTDIKEVFLSAIEVESEILVLVGIEWVFVKVKINKTKKLSSKVKKVACYEKVHFETK